MTPVISHLILLAYTGIIREQHLQPQPGPSGSSLGLCHAGSLEPWVLRLWCLQELRRDFHKALVASNGCRSSSGGRGVRRYARACRYGGCDLVAWSQIFNAKKLPALAWKRTHPEARAETDFNTIHAPGESILPACMRQAPGTKPCVDRIEA